MLGKLQRRPAVLDRQLAEELKSLHMPDDKWDTYIGRTMCTTDFYEGQYRGELPVLGGPQRTVGPIHAAGRCEM